MKKAILAGSSALFGFTKLKKAFLDLGFDAIFLEADFMKKYADFEFIEFCNTKTDFFWAKDFDDFFAISNFCEKDCVIIPLSEFWISQFAKRGYDTISDCALNASRSKSTLYKILKSAKINVPKIFDSINEARNSILSEKKSIIVKPDSLNSSYGVKIVCEKNEKNLEKYFFEAKNLKNHATKILDVKNSRAILCEKICGIEFSADCFYFFGKISLVRVCKKFVRVLGEKPCCICTEFFWWEDLKSNAELFKIENFLRSCCNAIFEKTNISFAQFDFIKTPNEEFFVIDFSARIGGGMRELFLEVENQTQKNIYALALEKFLNEKKLKPKNFTKKNLATKNSVHFFQFNFVAAFSGYIKNLFLELKIGEKKLEGKTTIFKNPGDFVTKNSGAAFSRIASFVVPLCENCINEKLLSQCIVNLQN